MAKYIKLFSAHTDYELAKTTLELPNVSHCIEENEVHYNPLPIWGTVDLGLSVKWARMNVGASSETDYGLFFAWGDISGYTAAQVGSGEGQKYFGWVNNGVNDYKYANGASNKLTKYCPSSASTYWDGGGDPDGLTTLELSDDAAFKVSNGQYRMPTKANWDELCSGTTNGFVSGTTFIPYTWNDGAASTGESSTVSELSKFNGVNGMLFWRSGGTTINEALSSGEYLFLPACGGAGGGSVGGAGQWGGYWSSSLDETYPNNGWYLYFAADYAGVYYYYRCYGRSFRAVLPQS